MGGSEAKPIIHLHGQEQSFSTLSSIAPDMVITSAANFRCADESAEKPIKLQFANFEANNTRIIRHIQQKSKQDQF